MNIHEWVDYVTKPSRLLIVDDNKGVADIIKTALRKFECEYVVVNSGEEAVKHIEAGEHFDLIFLDIQLPGMSGLEVLKVIKKVTPDVPVVIMSGYFSPNVLDESTSLGAVSFMRKPMHFNPRYISQIFRLYKIREVPHEMQEAAVPAAALTSA